MTDLTPGIYELTLKNGDLVRADVGILPGVGPWWARHGGYPSDDWRDVVDAKRLGDSAPTGRYDSWIGSRKAP